MGVGVGIGVSVAVGKGVAPAVAMGMDDAVGVTVEAGASDVQEGNERRKMERTMRDEAVLFRMGCILPLVLLFMQHPVTKDIAQKCR